MKTKTVSEFSKVLESVGVKPAISTKMMTAKDVQKIMTAPVVLAAKRAPKIEKLAFAIHAMGIKSGKYVKLLDREEIKNESDLIRRIKAVLDGPLDVSELVISVR